MEWIENSFMRILVAIGAALLIAGQGAAAREDGTEAGETADQLTQLALTLDAHPQRGAIDFDRHCASCHGSHAQGDSGRTIPALAGQRFAYVVRQLADFSSAERDSADMHRAISGKYLSNPQTWVDIAAFLNKAPVMPAAVTGDGTGAALGRGIFHEQCASCHQDDARGDDDGFVPSLRNQHYPYLVTQMHRLAQGRRHNLDESLMRFLGSFDARDVSAVADYLSRLRGPGRDRKTMRSDGVVVD